MSTNTDAKNWVYNRELDSWEPGENSHIITQIDATGVSSSTDYVLIDLSDTTNYPHHHTGCIGLRQYQLSIDPDTSFEGSLSLGFVENVDATNGDYYPVITYEMVKKPNTITQDVTYDYPVFLDSEHVATIPTTDDTGFQTDTAITSSTGTTEPGNGDMIMRVIPGGGSAGISVSVKYLTYES